MKKTLVRTFAASIALVLGVAAMPGIAAANPSVAATGPAVHQASPPAQVTALSDWGTTFAASGGNTTTKGSSDPCYPITPHNWAKCGGAGRPD